MLLRAGGVFDGNPLFRDFNQELPQPDFPWPFLGPEFSSLIERESSWGHHDWISP